MHACFIQEIDGSRHAVYSGLEQRIAHAKKDAAALIKTQAMSAVNTGYDKRAIEAGRVSPDAWVQLLEKLAHAQPLHARDKSAILRHMRVRRRAGLSRDTRRLCASPYVMRHRQERRVCAWE